MRPLLALAALAALAGGAVPALADGSTTPVPACAVSSGGRTVLLGTSAASFETPQIPLMDATTQELVLDLPVGEDKPKTAGLNITLSWDTPVSDFDMTVTGPDGTVVDSLNINALDGNTETAFISGVARCDSVMVEVSNFTGSPIEALTLTVEAVANT